MYPALQEYLTVSPAAIPSDTFTWPLGGASGVGQPVEDLDGDYVVRCQITHNVFISVWIYIYMVVVAVLI